MFGFASSSVINYFIILVSVVRTPAEAHIIEQYREQDGYGELMANDIELINTPRSGGMSNDEIRELAEMYLITKEEAIKLTYPFFNEMAFAPHSEIVDPPLPVSILKALEYLNANPDPGKHDNSRRVKRI